MRCRLVSRLPTSLLALIGYAGLSLLWLRPLPWRLATHLSVPTGDPAITAWRLVWPVVWLLRRPAPFLDTTVAFPTAGVFARDELTLGGSLVAAPMYLLTRNPVFAYNVTLIAAFAFTGYCTYLLATSWTGMRAAGFLAGCIVAFAPYRMAQVGHLGLVNFGWTSLGLWCIDRLIATRRARWAALLAAAAIMQTLSAGYYAYLFALAVALYLAAIAAFSRPLPTWRTILLIGGGLLSALVLIVPLLLPFARIAAQEHFRRALPEVEFWSARPQSYLAATPGNLIYGGLVRRAVWTNWTSEAYLFPGVVAVALACIGVVHCGARRRLTAVSFIIVAFILSLGPTLHLAQRDRGRFPLPYRAAYQFLPGVSALRAPLRIAPLLMLGVALLAAFGVRWLRDRATDDGRRGGILPRLLAPALTLCVLAEFLTAPLATVSVADSAYASPVRAWLAAQPPAVVCELPNLFRVDSVLRATDGHDRYVNGALEIRPPAERELFRLLDRFGRQPADTAEGLRVLQALGADYLALHPGEFTPERWATVKASLLDAPDDVTYRTTQGDTEIYQFRPAHLRYAALLATVPEGSRVFVSAWTANGTGMLGKALTMRLLAGRTITSTLHTGWSPAPAPPDPRAAPAFGVFYRTEPVPPGWDVGGLVWAEQDVVIYRAQ